MSKVRDIVKKAGGPVAVAKATGETDSPVRVDAVFKWYRNGVPDEHWSMLIRRAGVTPAELFAANCEARKAKAIARRAGPLASVAA